MKQERVTYEPVKHEAEPDGRERFRIHPVASHVLAAFLAALVAGGAAYAVQPAAQEPVTITKEVPVLQTVTKEVPVIREVEKPAPVVEKVTERVVEKCQPVEVKVIQPPAPKPKPKPRPRPAGQDEYFDATKHYPWVRERREPDGIFSLFN